jgi:hypothetical protein
MDERNSMHEPEKAPLVKLFVAALWRDPAALAEACTRMTAAFGAIDFEGPDHAFDATNYYDAEMGPGLSRRLISFAPLISPERIAALKLEACALEKALARGEARTVNLDAGYLDTNKVVLASLKQGPQKIYLGSGVWADLVALYRKGTFLSFEWTFADFKDGRYERDLLRIRERYKDGRKRPSMPE